MLHLNNVIALETLINVREVLNILNAIDDQELRICVGAWMTECAFMKICCTLSIGIIKILNYYAFLVLCEWSDELIVHFFM